MGKGREGRGECFYFALPCRLVCLPLHSRPYVSGCCVCICPSVCTYGVVCLWHAPPTCIPPFLSVLTEAKELEANAKRERERDRNRNTKRPANGLKVVSSSPPNRFMQEEKKSQKQNKKKTKKDKKKRKDWKKKKKKRREITESPPLCNVRNACCHNAHAMQMVLSGNSRVGCRRDATKTTRSDN